MADEPVLCCPRCHAELREESESLACASCAAVYPVVLGIPDLRVYPDPYIDFEADRAKARILAGRAAATDFASLVRTYWEITPATPRPAAERYAAYAVRGVERAHSALAELPVSGGALLDVGTGTAGTLVAAGAGFRSRVGVDVGLRWLVIARRRLEESGVAGRLVCACADRLPFAGEGFDAVTGIDLAQHMVDAPSLFAELARVLRPSGAVLLTMTNRLSLLPDPHTGLVGVGFLPRGWRQRYVERRGRAFDPNISPLGAFEAEGLARRFFHDVELLLPTIGPEEAAKLDEADRRRVRLYERLCRIAPARPILRHFGPAFWLHCRGPRRMPEGAAA